MNIPEGPGWGTEINEKILKKYEPKPIIGVIGARQLGYLTNQFIKHGYKVYIIAKEASRKEFLC